MTFKNDHSEQTEVHEMTSSESNPLRHHHLSRRRLLHRAAVLGLSLPVTAGLLAACGGDDDEEDEDADTGAASPTSGGGAVGRGGWV